MSTKAPRPKLEPHVERFIAAAEAVSFPPGVRFGTPEGTRYLEQQRALPRAQRLKLDVAELYETRTPAGVRVRVYRPVPNNASAVIVYFHGGGWMLGDLETHDDTCRRLAVTLTAVVVNVDYRLAPEHPFPAALDDAADATEWAISEAEGWGVDRNAAFVAGTSSGGNLAAAVAIRRRDSDQKTPLAGQLLIYPVLDSRQDTPSYHEKADGFFLSAEQMRFYWDAYVPAESKSDPWASPSQASDVSGLPPALIVTAEHDPLRDEGEFYSARLADSGTQVRLVRVPGQIHGFLTAFPGSPEVNDTFDEIANAVRINTPSNEPTGETRWTTE